MKKETRLKRGNKAGGAAHRRLTLSAVLLSAALITGCGAPDRDVSMSQNATSNGINYGGNVSADGVVGFESAEGWEAPKAEAGSKDTAYDAGRKLIRTVNLEVETREFDRTTAELEAKVRQLGGYIEKLETYNGSRYSGRQSVKYSNLTIRVPKENLDSFLETVSDVCNVVRQSEDMKDVTLSYVDMESRRNTLRTEQERLLGFLEQAETVEEIIALEERLSNVRYQLESMESQLRTIDNQVDYATVRLNISEVQELTPVAEQTAWERLVEGFGGNLRDIGEGFVEFAIWLVVNIPYFVVWGIVIALIVLLLRKLRTRTEEKREMLRREAAAAAEAERQRQTLR